MNDRADNHKMDRYKAASLRAFNYKWPDNYDRSFWVQFWTRRWDREIMAELPTELPSLRMLDVGCATGRLLLALGKVGVRHLAGVDLAPRILSVARHKLSAHGVQADLRVADAEKSLPWPDDNFSVVTLTGVLHHFSHPLKALAEIRRVLRPRGRLLIADPWFPPPIRQFGNLCLRFVSHDGDCHYYSPYGVCTLLRSQRFDELRSRRCDWHSFLVIGVKAG